MTTPTLKLELTAGEIDMAFVLFQKAKQDEYTYEAITALMKKIQDQGTPQLAALALKKESAPLAAKPRKPKAPKAPVVEKQQSEPVVEIPDLSDLKLD